MLQLFLKIKTSPPPPLLFGFLVSAIKKKVLRFLPKSLFVFFPVSIYTSFPPQCQRALPTINSSSLKDLGRERKKTSFVLLSLSVIDKLQRQPMKIYMQLKCFQWHTSPPFVFFHSLRKKYIYQHSCSQYQIKRLTEK